MFTIVQAPNEALRTPAKSVSFFDSRLQQIITGMVETMIAQKDPEGVGLAANQVNLPWKIFIARFGTKKNEPLKVFINPEILEHSEEIQPTDKDKRPPLEGCLSKPNYYGTVERWQWVKLKFQDENGKLKIEKFAGFPATVVQHEMDHLNGKIFIERILEQKGQLYKISKSGSKENWEEVDI